MPLKRRRERRGKPETWYVDSNTSLWFIDGVGSNVDLFGSLHVTDVPLIGRSTGQALQMDCSRVGQDFWVALEQFTNELYPYRQEALFDPEEIEATR